MGRGLLHHLWYVKTCAQPLFPARTFPECLACLSCPHASAIACVVFTSSKSVELCVSESVRMFFPPVVSCCLDYFKCVADHDRLLTGALPLFFILLSCPHINTHTHVHSNPYTHTCTSSAVRTACIPQHKQLHLTSKKGWNQLLQCYSSYSSLFPPTLL